jgi:hypothetical protein
VREHPWSRDASNLSSTSWAMVHVCRICSAHRGRVSDRVAGYWGAWNCVPRCEGYPWTWIVPPCPCAPASASNQMGDRGFARTPSTAVPINPIQLEPGYVAGFTAEDSGLPARSFSLFLSKARRIFSFSSS